ncbi:MAG TPA: ROK family transcriptional regulator [Anaerolineales bacterium]
MKKATHRQTKLHNRDLVLGTIFASDTISRAEIARLTKLTRTTVSDAVATLLAEGLVREVGFGSSIGGKNPILLSLVADSRFLVGLNLAQDKFIGAILNLRGEIKEVCELPVPDGNGERALELVYQILDQLLQSGRHPIVGIGVGAPGLINTAEGIVLNAVNLDWRDLPLAGLLQARYHLPVTVLNDSQATAIGEYVYGSGHNRDGNLVVVSVKQGIGAGILINGRLFQGDGGGAGEIGHVVAREDGELCRCGKRGCLETLASARAVIAQAHRANRKLSSLEKVRAAFDAGDAGARGAVLEAGRHLGVALANLIGTLNIQEIVLTGDMTAFGGPWLEAVDRAMKEAALGRMAERTRLETGKLDYRACILGASALMLLDGYSLLYTGAEEA